jgi:uncharacterized protein (TIGR00297 family)
VDRASLNWQSKLVMLLVLPFAGAHVVLEARWWAVQMPAVAIWTLGLSALFGVATLRFRAATPWGSAAGAAIVASLMFSTAVFPYAPWRTALVPVLVLVLLTFAATRLGRSKKESLGTAEDRTGRSPAQVAANLGMAAIVSSQFVQTWVMDHGFADGMLAPAMPLFSLGLAALAEAAADTVSSELGQVVGGRPRMITTLRQADPGTDGAISVAGTLAGIAAASIVAGAGTAAFHGGWIMFAASCAGGIFGLLFDSLLGATLEMRGLLNNDAVNFLSTGSAAAFALGMMAILPRVV